MIDIKKVELPSSPGVYKFINKESNIIYVGKSKRLNKRVKSYFQKQHNNKILKMIKEITKIDIVISESEHDALLLENNLIKEYKPKYNILLRDDKTYPYISIIKDSYPYLKISRTVSSKHAYIGPFSSSKSVRKTISFLERNFGETCLN